MNRVLEVSNLKLERGNRRVLNDVSIRIEQGKTTALLGPNGAGKSSLVLALSGMLPTASGTITFDGQRLNGRSPESIRALGIATVLEGHQVLTLLSVEDNLKVAGSLLERSALRTAIGRTYEIFPELAERRFQLAGSLSGGQQQMVALAQALIAKPAIVLADEMSLGLAPIVVRRLLGVLRALADDGCGILLIEQFTHIALGLADRVYVMNRGRIQFEGLPREVTNQPSLLHDVYFAGKSLDPAQPNSIACQEKGAR
ncbi:MAG: ABC transporter ATP-binding protein [Burkholderiales bacterium]